MFRAILFTQWKWLRIPLALLAVAAFAIPIVSARSLFEGGFAVTSFLSEVQSWGMAYPLLAVLAGVTLALGAWSPDRLGGQVYALSLPVPRWEFVLLRYGASVALLAVPVIALWLGACLAAVTTRLTPGLAAYPNALGLRFALACLVTLSLSFALAAGTARVLTWVTWLFVALIALQVIFVFTGSSGDSPISLLADFLFGRNGPLGILAGRWMLFDV